MAAVDNVDPQLIYSGFRRREKTFTSHTSSKRIRINQNFKHVSAMTVAIKYTDLNIGA